MAADRRTPRCPAGGATSAGGPAAAIAVAAIGLALLAGCASQGPPSGGPEDKDPPGVVVTEPPPGALNVGEGKITIDFSEYIDRRSLQESAFLSPSAGVLKYEWSGTSVEITAPDTLRPNTTYILTVGTDLKDTRNNTLTQAFTLAFSTGPSIDSCFVAGRIDDREPSGVMVYAYAIAGGRGDTLDPSRTKPDYLTQSGKDGTFLLRNLREGEYRLMAVRDAFRNLSYDVGSDAYGMAAEDIRLAGETRGVGGVGFRLTTGDTVRPFLSGAKAKDAGSVVLRFNEPVVVAGGAAAISIMDTLNGLPLAVGAMAAEDTGARQFVVTTARQDSGAAYRVIVSRFSDASGNGADSAGSTTVFPGGTGADTLAPVLTLNVARDSATGFFPLDSLRMNFTVPVDTGAATAAFRFTGADGRAVRGSLRWPAGTEAVFAAAEPFTPGAWYAVSVKLDSVRALGHPDGAGGSGVVKVHDSTLVRRFRIAEEKLLSEITGSVHGTGFPGARYMVEAREISGGGSRNVRVSAGPTGEFRIGPIAEGRYVLSAFVDLNGNGRHDCGIPAPVTFSEPFGILADTLRLRPRWPVEGVVIEVGR